MTDRIRKVLRAHKDARVFLSTVSGVAVYGGNEQNVEDIYA